MQLGALEYLISVNDSGLKKGISDSDKQMKSFGKQLSSWAVAKGQMIARVMESAVSSASDGIKSIVGGAFNAYADYEQLVGGVDTLFKENSHRVQEFAAQAYKTVGISANEYMENVTSFSASLLQSLGGNTEKAADVADMAMKDMADNMNKMGTPLESIQNAYQGFAKQNYTMLDNLKLGYGGTKSEMERLLKDAQKISGMHYDIKNLSDVYNAIHVIQQEMGITGTTAKEAETTIAGSMNSAKAAWKDLLSAIGSGNDVKGASKRFSDSAKTVIKNATPVISKTLSNLIESAKELWPFVKDSIKTIAGSAWQTINGLLPKSAQQLIDGGKNIISRLTHYYKRDGLKGIVKETKSIFARMLNVKNYSASWGDIGQAILDKIKAKINGDTIKELLLGEGYNSESTWSDVAAQITAKLKTGFKKSTVGVLNILGIDAETDDTWADIGSGIIDKIRKGIGDLKLKIADILGIETDGDTSWSTIGSGIIQRIKGGIGDLKLKVADLVGLEEAGDASWGDIGRRITARIKGGFGKFKLKIADLLGIEPNGDASWADIGRKIISRIKAGFGKLKLKINDLVGLENAGNAQWSVIATQIKTRLKDGLSKIQLKLADILDAGDNASWSDIGKKLAEGIGDTFKKGKSLLLKILLGDEYVEGESSLVDVGKKVADFIGKGFEEGGFVDTFIKNFSEKWTAIFTAAGGIIGSLADWLSDSANQNKLISVLVDIITIVANSIDKIVPPLVKALKQIVTSEGFINALTTTITSLVPALLDLAVNVISSPDIWNAIGAAADSLLRTLLGDNIVNKILGKRKKLVWDTDENGERHSRLVEELAEEDKDAKKEGLVIAGFKQGIRGLSKELGAEEGGLEDRLIRWAVEGEDFWNAFFDIEKIKAKAAELFKQAQGFFTSNPLHQDIVLRYSSTYWGPNNPDHIIRNAGSGGVGGQWGLVNVMMKQAKGDWSVPYDNYPSLLHRGEMVLTASQARRYRDGDAGGIDFGKLQAAIVAAVRSGMDGVSVNSYIDGREITDTVSRELAAQLAGGRYR